MRKMRSTPENGRTFDSAELQNYFSQQYWYVSIYSPADFPEEMLNVYETSNVALLTRGKTNWEAMRWIPCL